MAAITDATPHAAGAGAVEDAEAATIGTAAELAAAMKREVRHITVTSHLDLSGLQPVPVPVSGSGEGGEDALRDALDAATGASPGKRAGMLQMLLGNVRTGTETIRVCFRSCAIRPDQYRRARAVNRAQQVQGMNACGPWDPKLEQRSGMALGGVCAGAGHRAGAAALHVAGQPQ